MSNSQVAHGWANKTGNKQNGSNFFYEGETIYSYGHHFPIAKHIDGGKVLFTTQGYSVSTSKHINYVRQAVNHLDCIYVHNVKADSKKEHLDNIKEGMKEAGILLDKAKKARQNKEYLQNNALSILSNMKEYASLYLPRHKFNFDLDIVEAEQAKIIEKAKKKQAKEKKERVKAEKEKLDKWVAGENIHAFFNASDIKLRIKGEEVQTSQGARVPLVEAIAFFKLCERVKASKKALKAFTHKVGSFLPTEIKSNGDSVIGCHSLKFAEMRRIYKTIEA